MDHIPSRHQIIKWLTSEESDILDLLNKTIKTLLKVLLSIVAVPISFSILGVVYAIYKSLSISAGANPISLTPNPLDLLMNVIFIVAIFAVPGVIIWLIWKKI